jgi:hypothetical protein
MPLCWSVYFASETLRNGIYYSSSILRKAHRACALKVPLTVQVNFGKVP